MRSLRLSTLLVLLTSCASVPQSRLDFYRKENLDSAKAEEKLWEAVGLRLETRTLSFEGLEVSSAISSGPVASKQSQLQIRDPSELIKGDVLVGMNQQLLTGQSLDALIAIRDNLKTDGGGILIFLNQPESELKMVGADRFPTSSIELMPFSVSMPMVCVKNVRPGSWAEKKGFRTNDCFIGKAEFSEKIFARRWLINLFGKIRFLKTKISATRERMKIRMDDWGSAAYLFLEMFRRLGSFENKNGDVMELGSNLVLMVMRADRLETLLVQRHQFLGLGMALKHEAGPFWGRVEPLVIKVFADSGAEKAGLRAGDYVAAVNGKKVKTSWDVHRLSKKIGFGRDIEYSVYRGTETLKIKMQMEWVIAE